MSLENITLLPLLLLAFLPIILHLLDRRRARTVMWPAVRFLLAADRRVLRRLRLLEALLILSRTLAILFLILAVLHPFVTDSVLRRDGPDRRRGAVIIIDTSYSMAYRGAAGGSSSLERARDMALHLLEDFKPGDRVVLFDDQAGESRDAAYTPPGDDLADRDTERPSEVPEVTRKTQSSGDPYDLEAVRARVRALSFRSGTFRLARALDRAIDTLETLAAETCEIFILTDLTSTCLPSEDVPGLRLVRSRLQSLPAPATLSLLDCGAVAPRNRSISFVRSGTLAAGTDKEVKFEVGLSLQGEEETTGPIVVRLFSGLEELATGEVEPGASRVARVELSHPFDRGGIYHLTAQIAPDGLREDDVGYHVLEVHERLPVLVVGTPPGDEGPARFVRLALTPKAPDAPDVTVIFESDFTDQLEGETLSDYRVVIVCDLPRPSRETILQLEEYVRSGGGLILFCGPQTHADSWNRYAFRGRHGLLPGRLSTRETSGRFGAMHPADIRTDHRALSVFSAPDEGALDEIEIHCLTRTIDLSPDAVVLATAQSGDDPLPWMIEKPCGRGRIILFTTSATPGDTNLPRTSLFLPLLHQFARYVASTDSDEHHLRCGEDIRFALEGDTPSDAYRVIDPGSEEHPIHTAVEDGKLVGVFSGTVAPGFYEVHAQRPEDSQAEPRIYAANFPPGESDLERLSDERIAEARDRLGLEVVRDVESLTGRLVEVSTRRHYWPWMIAAAILFAFAELVLTHRLARGRAFLRE